MSRPAAVAVLLAAIAGSGVAAAPAAHASAATRAASWAESQAGVRENGTTNCSALINRWERDMGLRVPPCRPWCGALVHQAYLRAGIRLSARMIDPHRAYLDAVAGRRHLKRIPRGSVRRGDLLLFKFRSGVKASHMAIVRGRPANGKVRTAEGNVGHTAVVTMRGLRYAVLAARVVR
jgi:cell wall-associated NlpC family hydrolase